MFAALFHDFCCKWKVRQAHNRLPCWTIYERPAPGPSNYMGMAILKQRSIIAKSSRYSHQLHLFNALLCLNMTV
eukprot:280114-Amphidinium_carterae.1